MLGIDDAALATILAGTISTAGALYSNRKNIDAQRDANAINWEIARQNNATQIEMANTAHQREVRDLRAAGLNPILSAGGNGSSVPTLSAASIKPVHNDNAFEGLANSARGLSRYFGQTYKANLDAAQAGAALARTDAQNASMQYGLDYENAENDYLMTHLRNSALRKEIGVNWVQRDKSGVPDEFLISDPKKWGEAVDLMREGIRSDLKLKSNANWRANLSSFIPFVSPAAVNSAAGAARQMRMLRR